MTLAKSLKIIALFALSVAQLSIANAELSLESLGDGFWSILESSDKIGYLPGAGDPLFPIYFTCQAGSNEIAVTVFFTDQRHDERGMDVLLLTDKGKLAVGGAFTPDIDDTFSFEAKAEAGSLLEVLRSARYVILQTDFEGFRLANKGLAEALRKFERKCNLRLQSPNSPKETRLKEVSSCPSSYRAGLSPVALKVDTASLRATKKDKYNTLADILEDGMVTRAAFLNGLKKAGGLSQLAGEARQVADRLANTEPPDVQRCLPAGRTLETAIEEALQPKSGGYALTDCTANLAIAHFSRTIAREMAKVTQCHADAR